MILSVSRRTDIPAFYSKWFINRIKEGLVYVRNPFNYNQVSSIELSPEVVDCIVFWTKDPSPLVDYLPYLDKKGFKYYFQFTLTPYGNDLEVNLREKKDLIRIFKALSSKIGKERVILRYDPIIITDKYTVDYHIKAFNNTIKELHDYTDKVIFSFLDSYDKVRRNMKNISIVEFPLYDKKQLAKSLLHIAEYHGIKLEACAEKIDFCDVGIKGAHCIDGELVERIIGSTIKYKNKLDGNRDACGCMKCVDIGQYDSCLHNCLYCYANINKNRAVENNKSHNPDSRILFGEVDERKVVKRKDIISFKEDSNEQFSFWSQEFK